LKIVSEQKKYRDDGKKLAERTYGHSLWGDYEKEKKCPHQGGKVRVEQKKQDETTHLHRGGEKAKRTGVSQQQKALPFAGGG